MTCEVWAASTVLNQIFSKKSASIFFMASSLHACVVMCGYDVDDHSQQKIDIKFSAHDAFLEEPSSGTLKVKIFESQII
jgi:hypothetical protein